MWWKLFKAEMYKIIGHRWATSCLLWVFPTFAFVGISIFLFAVVGFSEPRENFGNTGLPTWTGSAVEVWNFANNPLGRLVLIGFAAVFFGGEYQWKTWKNTVPRSYRVPMILVKFIAVSVMVLIAFNLTALIWTVGMGLVTAAAGHDYGPAITGDVLSKFAQDYSLQMINAFIATIIAMGYAAMVAMVTRSILGSVIAGVVLTILETGFLLGLALIVVFTGWEEILHLWRFTPTYNLLNLTTWANDGTGLGFQVSDDAPRIIDSAGFSIAILAFWVFGLIALTVVLFQRRDLTE